jgi:arylsulfatase
MAAVLAVGALLGYLPASGRLNLSPRADAGPSPAEAASEKPAEPPGGARSACRDEVNKGRPLAEADRAAPGGGAEAPQPAKTAPAQAPAARAADKRPRNLIFVICDQETYHLTARRDYKLPARQALMRHGVTFRNHYIASAMCTASRAAFLTGQPPQVTGVFDQMQYTYQASLSPDRPNMGSALKKLGYRTAYFGKFEMDKRLLALSDTVNYSDALKPYGFDQFGATGDTPSGPWDGYVNDCAIASDGVRWLRTNVPKSRRDGQPFFLVLSFLNPHDIMFADANVPGLAPVQKPGVPLFMPPLPANALYERQWDFALAPSLGESLAAKGMPAALAEYDKGWSGALGLVPPGRKDMWRIFYNYYLNCIRDNDRSLQLVVDAMDDMGLWKDTAVVFTADHGEMAGAHGGLKGKGPFCYEANSHVPLIVAHPDAKPGTSCRLLAVHPRVLAEGGDPRRQMDASGGRTGQVREVQAGAGQAAPPASHFSGDCARRTRMTTVAALRTYLEWHAGGHHHPTPDQRP